MFIDRRVSLAGLMFGLLVASTSMAGLPVGGEEVQRRLDSLEKLQRSIAAEHDDVTRFAHLAAAMTAQDEPDFRHKILVLATLYPGPACDAFFAHVLANDPDAGIRGDAATALCHLGSEAAMVPLADAAANDSTTTVTRGCMVGQSNARRAATLALAELAERFPRLADGVAAKLRALPAAQNPQDKEGLADARLAALFRVTHDPALLKTFEDRLASQDATTRVNGVVAYRFVNLKKAPASIVNAIKDPSADVRSWALLTLGEIGDPATVAPLISLATDAKQDAGLRCGAVGALGTMRAPAAAEVMEKLLAQEDGRIQVGAAIALYRITGKKVKQFPAAYNAD